MINLTGRCNAAAASAATITLIYLCAQSSISSTCTKHNVFPPLFNTLHCTHISGVALEFCDYPFGNILSFAHLVHTLSCANVANKIRNAAAAPVGALQILLALHLLQLDD